MNVVYKQIIKTCLISVETEIEDLGDVNYRLEISIDNDGKYYSDVYRLEMYRLNLLNQEMDYSDELCWIKDINFNDRKIFDSQEDVFFNFKEKLKHIYNIPNVTSKIDALQFII